MKGQFIRLEVDSCSRGWVRRLPWGVRACWPIILAIVKAHGVCGQIGEKEFFDWTIEFGIPDDELQEFLEAAQTPGIDETVGAIIILDGVLTITNWSKYQTDPKSAERSKAYRERQKGSPAPLPKEETDTETETVTDVTGSSALARARAVTDDDAAAVEIGDGGIGNPPRTAPLPDIPLEAIGHVRKAYLSWCEEHGYPKNWRGTWDSDIGEHCRINGDDLAFLVTPAVIDAVDRRAAREMKPWVSCPKSWFAEAEQRAKPKRTAGPTIRAAMDPAAVLEASRKRGEEERKRAMAKGVV
jgi:hypothetical protein